MPSDSLPSDTVALSISSEQTRPLRHQVLRPHQPIEACNYPLDSQVTSGHYGVSNDTGLVAVGSIFQEAQNGHQTTNSWRIRGMATEEKTRGRGYGGRVLEALIQHARERGGKVVWCNGRVTVEGFYGRFGFQAQGDVFELPGLGPHLLLALKL